MNAQQRLAPTSTPEHDRRRRIVTAAMLLALAILATVLIVALPSFAQDQPASPQATPPAPIYVDCEATGGAGNGTSWTDAYTNLHDALSTAEGDEIWVAECIYYPDVGLGQTLGDRTAAFRLEQGVAVYGGFNGTESARDERKPDLYVTVLSGDIDHDDDTTDGVVTDPILGIHGANSYHVVTAQDVMKAAQLDGFTITAGLADSDTEEVHCQGAGIHSLNASPTLSNLMVRGNKAACGTNGTTSGYGGGMYMDDSSPEFTNVTFADNYAGSGGGGLYTTGSDGAIENLTFISNEAGSKGGGMVLDTSLGQGLLNLTFTSNSAGEAGGGLYVQSTMPSTLGGGSDFTYNTAPRGGGLYLDASQFNLSSVDVQHNEATEWGGGMFAQSSTSSLSDVDFESNHAGDAGGGIYADTNDISLSNGSSLTGNTSLLGAGIYVDDHSSDITEFSASDTTFTNNVADQDGGGLYVVNSLVGSLTGVWFIDNEATAGYGGGIYFGNSDAYALTNTSFDANTAIAGGGLYADASNPTLTNVTFSSNEAQLTDIDDTLGGGGVYLTGASNAILSRCTFSGNSAANGGGVYIYNSNPDLTNVAFRGNQAAHDGGGLWNDAGQPALRDVLFSGNRATLDGGGMRSGGSGSNVTITNATFSGNAAGGDGGGLHTTDANIFIYNTVIWNNLDSSGTGTPEASIWGSVDVIDYSLVQNHALAAPNLDGTNPLNDPQFVVPVDPTGPATTAGVLSVKYDSPIVDVGYNDWITGVEHDLAGNARVYNGTVDLGVYELPLACPPPEYARLYVDRTKSVGNSGISWAEALKNLRDAFTLATDCGGITEIWVADGVYRPDEGVGMVPDSREEIYEMVDGVAVYGGFAGSETLLEERDWVANLTVLSGDVDGNDIASGGIVNVPGNIVGANSYHVVVASGVGNTTILDGFTITAGQANGSATDPQGRGGGIYNDGGSPTLGNLTFIGSFSQNGGGLANLNGGNPTLTSARFENNQALSSGGGIYNEASSPTLSDLVFTGNFAASGSGMANLNGNPSLTGVQFRSNNAGSKGGGIYNEASNPTLTAVEFTSNNAGSKGGGIYNQLSSPTLTDVTLSGNSAPSGGAIYNDASAPTLINALVSGNYSATSGAGFYNTGSGPVLVNVTVTGNRAGTAAGGMFNTADSHPGLHNSIFWDNRDATGTGTASATIHNDDLDSEPDINYSLVQALSGIDHIGGNNRDADPLFTTPLDPITAPSTAGDFTLVPVSPAIDAGDNAANPTSTDLAGGPRVINAIIDLGPYEAPYTPIFRVYLPMLLRDYP